MIVPNVRAVLSEARSAIAAVRGDVASSPSGDVVVSGMLAEQLARELGADADPGAVRAVDGARLDGAAVAVRVIAAEPSSEDTALVGAADRAGVPVVLVQLWPQPDWTPPFVLSPFVVECATGESFPVRKISARIVEAVEDAAPLAARIPSLREPTADAAVRQATVRAALLALTGRSRPTIALEQLRLVPQLRSREGEPAGEIGPQLVATAGAILASGFVLREAARSLRRALPAPAADALIAAAGTWALARALRRRGS